jgi:hypothetical protein
MKCTVNVKYTNGAGNNIFQYVFARLLAEAKDCNLSTQSLPILGIEKSIFPYNDKHVVRTIGRSANNHIDVLSEKGKWNYSLQTYPEDYLIYKPHLKKIRSWFNVIEKREDKDLVFHLRLGDRLLNRDNHDESMKVLPESYSKTINSFSFDNLHVVTDMPKWGYITEEDLSKMKFHIGVPLSKRVAAKESVDYFNSIVEELSMYSPKVRVGNSVKSDFDFMRSFNQIMFQHGTLSWWAATLSNAEKVGVFGPWRPIKGKKNKNLGQTDFPGWFQWDK